MGLAQTTAPSEEPVSLEEARLQAKVESTDDDTLVSEMIEAAREVVEDVTDFQLVSATWTWTLDRFPAGRFFVVPHPPMTAVTSIKYLDSDGVQQTWDAGSYDTDFTSIPGRIALAHGESWPTIRGGEIDSVEVIFVAGYANAAAVPSHYKQAMRLIVADWYKNREDSVDFRSLPILRAAINLMSQRSINWIA